MTALTHTITAAALSTVLATSATAADAAIELVNEASAVSNCERLAEVRGSSAWGGIVTNMAYNRALSQMKERAAKAGGTHVLLMNVSSGYSGSNMLGVAYRCPSAPASIKNAGDSPP